MAPEVLEQAQAAGSNVAGKKDWLAEGWVAKCSLALLEGSSTLGGTEDGSFECQPPWLALGSLYGVLRRVTRSGLLSQRILLAAEVVKD